MNETRLPNRLELAAEFSAVSFGRSLFLITFDWALIFLSIGVATSYPGVFSFVCAQLVIAARQHSLFLTMHEATHYNICKNRKWNDHFSNFLAAWPVGFSTERYRTRHWLHHRYLNTDKDPDWFRKKLDPSWQFPMSKLDFWRHTLPHLLGKGVVEMSYALRGIGIRKSDLPLALPFYAVIAAAITLAGGWQAFLLYWVLPYGTILPFLHRVRNASDHLGLPKTHLLNGTRNVTGSRVGAFFFGPHNANLHLVHHVYPFVPWYRLPAVHSFLLQNAYYREYAHENDVYLLPTKRSVFSDMTSETDFGIQETRKAA